MHFSKILVRYRGSLKNKYSAVALRQLAEVEWLSVIINIYNVYAVYNRKNNKFYIGQTNNLKERVGLHNDKTFSKSYTASFDGEWKLIYSEQAENREIALKREKQLKSYRGREFIKKYIPQ